MGLLQKAVETYDIMENSSIVGVYKNDRPPLAPVSHIVTTAKIQIMLDSDGGFIDARKVDRSEPKIIIPVTEESAGRTSSPVAHPLCEQIGYLSGKDEKRFGLYMGIHIIDDTFRKHFPGGLFGQNKVRA